VVRELYETVNRLKEKGITIFLSEQNADFALRLSDRAYILEKGQVCWHGNSTELKEKPEIMKKYLGV